MQRPPCLPARLAVRRTRSGRVDQEQGGRCLRETVPAQAAGRAVTDRAVCVRGLPRKPGAGRYGGPSQARQRAPLEGSRAERGRGMPRGGARADLAHRGGFCRHPGGAAQAPALTASPELASNEASGRGRSHGGCGLPTSAPQGRGHSVFRRKAASYKAGTGAVCPVQEGTVYTEC